MIDVENGVKRQRFKKVIGRVLRFIFKGRVSNGFAFFMLSSSSVNPKSQQCPESDSASPLSQLWIDAYSKGGTSAETDDLFLTGRKQ
jgi:hypothetical protein